jgi:endonuclease IV
MMTTQHLLEKIQSDRNLLVDSLKKEQLGISSRVYINTYHYFGYDDSYLTDEEFIEYLDEYAALIRFRMRKAVEIAELYKFSRELGRLLEDKFGEIPSEVPRVELDEEKLAEIEYYEAEHAKRIADEIAQEEERLKQEEEGIMIDI